MPTQTFIADSAADALAQIKAELGPDAVVLNVRQVAGPGITRLWQKPRIEVVAHVPDPTPAPAPVPPTADGVAELRRELVELRTRMELDRRRAAAASPAPPPESPPTAAIPPSFREPESEAGVPAHFSSARRTQKSPAPSGWKVGEILERSGLNPLFAQRVEDELIARHGRTSPGSLGDELQAAQDVFTGLWRPAPAPAGDPARPHVLLGAPGVGKTTLLCKWLAQAVLLEGRRAHVWRLDSNVANTAEALSVYGEILGLPVARFWRGLGEAEGTDLSFVDLPGLNLRDDSSVKAVQTLLGEMPGAQLHLVVNAAYEVPLLLTQLRALAVFGPADVCVTHLDEEPRWGKLWNLTLGTNLPLRFLSAGQNIPGDLLPASAEKIFSRQFSGF